MKAKDPPRFEIDALRRLVGEKVFARGESYHRAGQVEILLIEPNRVLAQVSGTEDYRTELVGRGNRIDGACSCPAFGDWGFCKHMVAVALAANTAGIDAGAEGVGALSRIRDHLRQKGVDALVGMIVDLAERDPALFRKLDLAAATRDADDKTLRARLRKAIDGATRTRDYVEYGEAGGWAAGVDEALDAVAELASGSRAGLALELVEHAIERIEQAIASIDDSDGYCSPLLERARDIHLAAATTARPDPVQLARNLFAREVEDDYDTFASAGRLYADVLGEGGLAEYRRLAVAAWDKKPRSDGDDEFSIDRHRLTDILDFFAERDGDVDARIALRTHDLSSAWRYLELATFCLSQGRTDEALRRAEEGLWIFEDGRPDERLVSFVAELLLKAGRKEEAEAHLWRAFEKAPSLELYARLRKLGGKVARERAVKFLAARLADNERAPWRSHADLLVRILIDEKIFDTAWAVIREHQVSIETTDALAQASATKFPREALEVYSERVNQFASTGGNAAYAEAAKLVARMAALRNAAEQATYIAALKERHGKKRNFMKLLG